MKTKKIEKLYEGWAIAWPCSGEELVAFMAKKIKKHFQRRKPKCVWTKHACNMSSSGCGTSVALDVSNIWEYCPYCGGKIEVKDGV